MMWDKRGGYSQNLLQWSKNDFKVGFTPMETTSPHILQNPEPCYMFLTLLPDSNPVPTS